MPDAIFHDGNRELQRRFDTERLADRVGDLTHDTINKNDRAFIEHMDMFFIATVDEQGHANCSYKGGEPGFVRVVDDHTIAFPNYDGNGMYLSMGNVLKTKQVGILFIDFENQHRMRLNGEATISYDDPLMTEYPEAQFIVRVRAHEIFPSMTPRGDPTPKSSIASVGVLPLTPISRTTNGQHQEPTYGHRILRRDCRGLPQSRCPHRLVQRGHHRPQGPAPSAHPPPD